MEYDFDQKLKINDKNNRIINNINKIIKNKNITDETIINELYKTYKISHLHNPTK